MAKNQFGDEIEEVQRNAFGDPIEGVVPVATMAEPVPPEMAFDRAGKVWDAALENDVPVDVAQEWFYDATITASDPSNVGPIQPVPDNRTGFSENFKREWTFEKAITKLPIIGGVIGISQNIVLKRQANRLLDSEFDYDELNRHGQTFISRETDRLNVAKAIKDFEFQGRGKTFRGKVAVGISQLPTWMIEFAATGGLASLGDDAAQKAGEKLLGKYAKSLTGKTAIATGKLVKGAVVRTSTGLLARVGEKATARQALIDIGVAGEENWATSLAKAWGDVAIESFSEETGKVFSLKALSALPFAGKFIPNLQREWISLTGRTSENFVNKLLVKGGYSTIIGELGEERVATVLREATGVSDRKGTFGQRIWAGMKEDLTLDNLGAEFVTILGPASIRRGMAVGVSLTKGVSVPTVAEQLDQATGAGPIQFDSPEDAQGYAAKAKEVAATEGKDVKITVDPADNTVTVEAAEAKAAVPAEAGKPPILKQGTKEEVKFIGPPIKAAKTVNEPQKEILGGVDPVDRVLQSLQEAKRVQPLIKAEQKAELSRRVGAMVTVKNNLIKQGIPTEVAIFRATSQLKGELVDYEQRFESIHDDLSGVELNALFNKINSHPSLSPLDILNTTTSFRKLLIGAALTDGDVKNIERVFGKGGISKIARARIEVSSLFDKGITLWKAGLLTGIKTSGLNTLSNLTHAMTETAKDIPAAGVDSVVSLFTGERALAFTTKGSLEGAKKGVRLGWVYLRTGQSERDIGKKLDFITVNFGDSKFARAIQIYEESIFHLLGAEDQPFYYGAKARSIFSQAIAQAKNKKLKGAERDAFVEKLIQNPTDDMLEAAVHDAEVAVFQNRTGFGDIARAVQKTKVGQIIVPFGRTPSAVATQIINYSPIGPAKEVIDQISKGEFNQRKFSQAFGRGIVGTGALAVGGLLLKAGLMTLDRPRTERERKLWEIEGRKPNSIKIGDKWRSVQVLGPAGNVLVIGGHFQEGLDQTGSPTKAIVQAMTGGAKSFSEQTFVTGVNQAVSALTDPQRSFENWFSSMAGSVVPTIVSDIARAQDDKTRRTEGPFQRVQSRIPVLREKLPPKIDVFGQDLPRYGGNPLEVMVDPTRPALINNDVVVTELRRLFDNNIKVSPTLLGDKAGFDVLTTEENTQLWRRSGELTYKLLQSWITSDGYNKIPNDFAKGKTIEELVSKSKAAAKAEMAAIKINQGVGIVELAEAGLLTVRELEAIRFFGQ